MGCLARVVLGVGAQLARSQHFASGRVGFGEADLQLAVGEQRGIEPGADVALGVGQHAARAQLEHGGSRGG